MLFISFLAVYFLIFCLHVTAYARAMLMRERAIY